MFCRFLAGASLLFFATGCYAAPELAAPISLLQSETTWIVGQSNVVKAWVNLDATACAEFSRLNARVDDNSRTVTIQAYITTRDACPSILQGAKEHHIPVIVGATGTYTVVAERFYSGTRGLPANTVPVGTISVNVIAP